MSRFHTPAVFMSGKVEQRENSKRIGAWALVGVS